MKGGDYLDGNEKHLCENDHCDNPAPFGFICFRCVDQLEVAINEFDNYDLDELYQIAVRDIRPVNRDIRTTLSRTLRQDALNVVAYTLWEQLSYVWLDELPTLHKQRRAKSKYEQIMTGCEIARNMIHGEIEYEVSPDHLNEKMDQIPSMTPDDVSTWLRENMNVKVSARRIHSWKKRGKIQPRHTKGGANYYHPADILKALEKSRESYHSRR